MNSVGLSVRQAHKEIALNETGRASVLMKQLTSIRSILVIAFTLSLVIPITVMMVYTHHITGRALAEQATAQQLHEVTLQAQHIEQSLDRIREDAIYLTRSRGLRQFQSGTGTRAELEQDLMIFATARPMIERLLIVQSGERLGLDNSTTTPRLIDADVLESMAYQTLSQTYRTLDVGQFAVSFDLVWGTPVLRYGLGLQDGILIIDVSAAWVLRNMPGAEAQSIWAILNQNGQHLLFPLLSEDYAGALPATDTAFQPYLPQLQESVTGTFHAHTNTIIYRRIYPTNHTHPYWLLYQQMPHSDLYAVVEDFYRSSTLILLVAIISALGVSVVLAEQIIRPLLALQRKVRRFADGEMVSKSRQRLRINELNNLHQSFYQMAVQLESESQHKRQLIKQLINAREDERKRIAYDLHDGLIQQLVVAKMYTAMLKMDTNKEAHTAIEQSEEAIKVAIVEGRRMIEGLHPTILDDLGLIDAIAEIGNQEASRYGWQLQLNLEALPYEPDKTVAITVFRICQEALNNIGKHANASQVTIELTNSNGVNLTIVDNGQGFDIGDLEFSYGFGIGTMRERTLNLSGHFSIESQLDHGTIVSIQIPYS